MSKTIICEVPAPMYAQVFAVAFPVALVLVFAPELWNRILGRE